MTRKDLVLLAAGGSAAMLLFALVSQYGFGLYPCPLCIWQRWPHLAAVLIGGAALVAPLRIWPWLGILAALATAGIGGFHSGVEQGWWAGLESCAGSLDLGAMSVETLLDPSADVAAPPRCDEVAASFLGVSMASWNMIFSLGLAGLWFAAARKPA